VQPSTSISHVLCGNFTGTPKQQELLLVRGEQHIELLRIKDGRALESISLTQCFGVVRSVSTLRLPGETAKDLLVVGSDSGVAVVLAWKPFGKSATSHGSWERAAWLPFGKSGCRRTVPGQLLAVDPRGRAFMLAAPERCKFAFTVTRSSEEASKIQLSSPLEAHRSSFLCLSAAALDAGLDNPLFVAIEVDLEPIDEATRSKGPLNAQKQLALYELDLGLNVMHRRWSGALPEAAGSLLPLPGGGSEGPGGVIVACIGGLLYYPGKLINAKPLAIPLEAQKLVTATGLVRVKGSLAFVLVQVESGNVFKLTFDWTPKDGVKSARVRLFEHLSIATGLAVTRSGHLFLASQSGDHQLFTIHDLGDHADEPELVCDASTDASVNGIWPVRTGLRNLTPVDRVANFAPLTDGRILSLGGEEAPQLYLSTGQSFRNASVNETLSSCAFSVCRKGMAVIESAAAALPGDLDEAKAVFTISLESGIFCLIAHAKQTVPLLLEGSAFTSASENTALTDFDLVFDETTLAAGMMREGLICQITPSVVKLVKVAADSTPTIIEWKPPTGNVILAASFNAGQVALSLTSSKDRTGEESHSLLLIGFELGAGLLDVQQEISVPVPITRLALEPLRSSRKNASWLVVGSDADLTVRVLSIADELSPVAIQALTGTLSELLLVREDAGMDEGAEASALKLWLGLDQGIVIVFDLDEARGLLLNPTSKFIGAPSKTRGVRFAQNLKTPGSIYVLGSKPWLAAKDRAGRSAFDALFYPGLSVASALSDGRLVAVTVGPSPSIRVLAPDDDQRRLVAPFYRHPLPLPLTTRRLAHHPTSDIFLAAMASQDASTAWTGACALVNPFTGTVTPIPIESDLACIAGAFVTFHDQPERTFVAVAWARKLCLAPRKAETCGIDLFPVQIGTEGVQVGALVHQTPLEDAVPSAIHPFNGRLLVAAGLDLRLYECGSTRLLRKTQMRLPSAATCIATQGLRIYVGTLRDSILLLQYRADGPIMSLVADDPLPRGISKLLVLDYDTVVVVDRFGTFSMLRLSAAVSEQIEREGMLAGNAAAGAHEHLLAAPHKLERLAEFYLGDVVTCLAKTAWNQGSREAIWYATVSGAIGVLLPLPTRNTATTALQIESALKTLSPDSPAGSSDFMRRIDLLGRAHLPFRSSFHPAKSVVDGDLLEVLVTEGAQLSTALKHQAVAAIVDSDKPLKDIVKKISEWRAMIGI
jgi:splicing factor 3B subunit 3